MFLFLAVVQTIVAAALVGVILMQRSEGGGLGIGGSPAGMLGARGAADFLTRTTKWLSVIFVLLSIALAAVAVDRAQGDAIETTLDRGVQPAGTVDPLGGGAAGDVPPLGVPETGPAGLANDPLANTPAEPEE
jgi:preprotein translocase subunit SecG